MHGAKLSPFLYVIIGLAGIGLLSWITREPGQLLSYIIMTALIGTLIFFIARAIIRRRTGNENYDETRKYRQAVKQSQKKYKHKQQPSHHVRSYKRLNRRRRRPSHLTLIKGNKSGKKNNNDRASN